MMRYADCESLGRCDTKVSKNKFATKANVVFFMVVYFVFVNSPLCAGETKKPSLDKTKDLLPSYVISELLGLGLGAYIALSESDCQKPTQHLVIAKLMQHNR